MTTINPTNASTDQLWQAFDQELTRIADWWLAHTLDQDQGGFYGEVGRDNSVRAGANKGIVLNTRILWFFSEMASEGPDAEYALAARRAYEYITRYFLDSEQGGVYWELTPAGEPFDTKKQVYAQAFYIYALTSYYKLTGDADALAQARRCFELIENYAVDRQRGGYLEAFSRTWGEADDIRLSEKDLNFPKTMNTHLHVLEAYTALHSVAPDARVQTALRYTIDCFDKHMINRNNHHLRMFLDMAWQDQSTGFSYGHDIEFTWLLIKALDALGDAALRERLLPVVQRMADACIQEAVGPYGELADAYEFAEKALTSDRIWWVQAEALVGFLKLYTLTGAARYNLAFRDSWRFIRAHQIDADNGEWLWLSSLDDNVRKHYKAGFWKGPYHNGRAMMEGKRLLESLRSTPRGYR